MSKEETSGSWKLILLMRTIFSMQELLFLKGTLHVGCYVILKIVIKDTFISNFVWLEVEKKEKKRGRQTSLCLGPKT